MKDVSLRDGINWAGCVETEPQGRRDDWLQVGDILVAARGSHNYAILVDADLQEQNQLAIAAPHFFVVRTQADTILPAFLTWLLNQTACQRYFEQNAEGSVTKSIRRSVLEFTPIVIPPLVKQQSVVELAHAIRKEQRILHALIQNHEKLLGAIATNLLNEQANEFPN